MLLPKSPRVHDRKYLDSLRELPCLVTGRLGNPHTETVDPCHFRWGGTGGAGMKPSDWYAIPLLHSEHMKQGEGERKYWLEAVHDNPLILAEFIRDALKWRYFERMGKMPE